VNYIYKSRYSGWIADIKCLIAKKPKVKYVGWAGYGNLGDEVLFEVFKQLFRSFYLHPKNIGRFAKLISLNLDAVILGGGTLINRSDGREYLDEFIEKGNLKRVVFGTGVANSDFWKNIPNSINIMSEWVTILNAVRHLSVRGANVKSYA